MLQFVGLRGVRTDLAPEQEQPPDAGVRKFVAQKCGEEKLKCWLNPGHTTWPPRSNDSSPPGSPEGTFQVRPTLLHTFLPPVQSLVHQWIFPAIKSHLEFQIHSG